MIRPVLLACWLTAGLALAQAPAPPSHDVQTVEIGWTPGAWRASVSRGAGELSWSEPDLWPGDLPPGTLYFVILGNESGGKSPVLARGRLADPARMTLDPEEDGVTRPFRSLEVDVARAITQVRLPAEPQASRIVISRVAASGKADQVFAGPIQGGGGGGGGAAIEPVHGAGLAPNRVGIVFAADGFIQSDFASGQGIDTATDDIAQKLLACPPFDVYGHLLGFARVETPSTDMGVNREGQPFPLDTYFGVNLVHVRKNGQLTTDPGMPKGYRWRMPDLSDAGWSKLLPLSAGARRDVLSLILNYDLNEASLSLWDGGPLGVLVTTTGRGAAAFIHQIGHTIGGLGDEHVSTPPLCVAGEPARPNVDTRTDRASVRWNGLITAGLLDDPVPGGMGCDRGFTHPRAGCVMSNEKLGLTEFCEACQEAIVDGLYARVRLADAREPADPAPVIDSTAPPTFTVRTNARSGQTIVATWTLDGEAIKDPAGSGPVFTFTPPAASWAPGRHVVRLLLDDQTRLGGGGKETPMLLHSMPQEVRWDVTVRSAGPASLVPAGAVLTSSP